MKLKVITKNDIGKYFRFLDNNTIRFVCRKRSNGAIVSVYKNIIHIGSNYNVMEFNKKDLKADMRWVRNK